MGGGCGLEQISLPGDWAGKGGGSGDIQRQHPALCPKGGPRGGLEDWLHRPQEFCCGGAFEGEQALDWPTPPPPSLPPLAQLGRSIEPQRQLCDVFLIFIIYTPKLGGRVCL